MKKSILFSLAICLTGMNTIKAQDTFSIVAVDSVTGEVGSAGASCLDLFTIPAYSTNDFISELFPGVGGINCQAAYLPANQANARTRMNVGDSPSQIISWLIANDVNAAPQDRQYGVVKLTTGSPKVQVAGHTGSNCIDYKNNISGKNYSIQGNILVGAQVLDSMEARFNRQPGDLACKLMAAMQGAKMVGADARCSPYGTSSLFAFLKVSPPSDVFGSPSFFISLRTHANDGIEPIDSLQTLFNKLHTCATAGINDKDANASKISIYPNPAVNAFIIKITGNYSAKATCTIKDVLGRKIMEEQINSEKTIDIGKWENGIYFVEVTDGTTHLTRKVVKQ